MKAASVTKRSLGGTMRNHCLRFVGVTNWSWFTLPSSDMFTCSGLVRANPASFSTPALNVAESITFCRLPKLPSLEKCSSTMLIILGRGSKTNIKASVIQHIKVSTSLKLCQLTSLRLFRSPYRGDDRLRPLPTSEGDQDWDFVSNSNGPAVDRV